MSQAITLGARGLLGILRHGDKTTYFVQFFHFTKVESSRVSEMLVICLGSNAGEEHRACYAILPISNWNYIYIYICVCVCVDVYTYVCVCIHIYDCIVCSSEITSKDGNRTQCAWGLPSITLLKIT